MLKMLMNETFHSRAELNDFFLSVCVCVGWGGGGWRETKCFK